MRDSSNFPRRKLLSKMFSACELKKMKIVLDTEFYKKLKLHQKRTKENTDLL